MLPFNRADRGKAERLLLAAAVFAAHCAPVAAQSRHGYTTLRVENQDTITASLGDADPVGQIELEGKDDPTFERVAHG